MKLKIKSLKFSAGRPVAILDLKTANQLNVHLDDRVLIQKGKKQIISIIDIAKSLLEDDEIAVSQEVLEELNAKERDKVFVTPTFSPKSLEFIYKKLNCTPLNEEELKRIINDIVKNALTEAEIAYFVSSIYKCGMSIKEIEFLIKAIINSGKTLKLKGKVADKHSIGGIAGNRTTPIVVSICSSAGLIMPKTSSRAITSAAGTADVIESVAKVEFSIPELHKILKKTNACIVWGGSLGLAPADDKLIQVERLLNLDPEPQLLASILAKKISVGSKYILIDLPYGKSAKISRKQGLELKRKFELIAKNFNLTLKCVLTDGSHPIGRGVGPILEIRDIISILKQEKSRPLDLEKKSILLSGLLLELAGKAKKGEGKKLALKILQSGQAFKKFNEIIKAQGGHLNNLQPGKFSEEIKAGRTGKLIEIDNKRINFLARILGSPADKGAGIYIHKNKNSRIKKAGVLFTFYAESKEKLEQAINLYKKMIVFKIK